MRGPATRKLGAGWGLLLLAAGAASADESCHWVSKPQGYTWDCSGFALGGPYEDIGDFDEQGCGWARKDGAYWSVCFGQTTGGPFLDRPPAHGACGWTRKEDGAWWVCSGIALGGPYTDLSEPDPSGCLWAVKDGGHWRVCQGQAVGGPFLEAPGPGAKDCGFLRKDDGLSYWTCAGLTIGEGWEEVGTLDAENCGWAKRAGGSYWTCIGQKLDGPYDPVPELDANGCGWLEKSDGAHWWCKGFALYGPLAKAEQEPFERVVLRGGEMRPGDYVVVRFAPEGKSCGYLMQSPEKFFVQCAGKIEQGPLSAADLRQTAEAWSAQSRFAHNLTMSVMRNWPSGNAGIRVDVYDQNGRFLRTETKP